VTFGVKRWVGRSRCPQLLDHKIVDINLDLIKGYTAEVANNIYYFGWLATKQVLVEKDIDIYRYKEIIELGSISIKDI
jgi:hypothetical protein